MMDYVNKISSLQDKASAQVAINLCQDDAFKEVAMRLEKPTYGGFIPYKYSPFVSDPEKLSVWAKMEKDQLSLGNFERFCDMNFQEKINRWDAAIDEQCRRRTEMIPRVLRQGIHFWIKRIALEYLSYSLRQEFFWGVSRYDLMNTLTREDWKLDGRLDEKKLAERLLEDKRFTVLQRYRIACVYCLHAHIPQLWKKLTQEERWSIIADPKLFGNGSRFIKLWSDAMCECRYDKLTENYPWDLIAKEAACYGNRATLMSCWKMLEDQLRQHVVIDISLTLIRLWRFMKCNPYSTYKHLLLLDSDFISPPLFLGSKYFNLPSNYSELVHFFVLQMDKEQQLTFFETAFQKKNCDSVLEYLLDSPYQDDFLSTINRLWGIIPEVNYAKCLLTLACKYRDEKENRYYDYRSLLRTLWANTPQEYRQYVFRDKLIRDSVVNEGSSLLSLLLERSPFQEKDETLFKLVFRDQPLEERRAMMRSEVGKNICSLLTQKEMWSFGNWLLKECLPKEETLTFKKQFIQSDCGRKLCLDNLEKNRERLVEDLIDWCYLLDAEKTKFKCKLVDEDNCLNIYVSLLRKREFIKVERMINFCLSSDEAKKRVKVRLADYTCRDLLEECTRRVLLDDCFWELMDTILAWSVDAQEEIALKKGLFSIVGIDTHFQLVSIRRQWEDVERFYKWFGLSPEEVKELKKAHHIYFEVKDKADRGDLFAKHKGEKRSVTTEEISCSPRKRSK